ncbi:hepcidin-like [Synchiropus splendidus]|uniref:hepcidin-like n=1 Tax=Synchiropus splendidus TaxID=270530 RepID=UPI00237E1126|nr:hepcidin-like [Synchiropus splendidus]
MKPFSVAVVVAVMVVVVCVHQSSALPLSDVEEQQEMMMESPANEHEEMALNPWEMPHSRQKRRTKCRFCCGCCGDPGVCGTCCKKRF